MMHRFSKVRAILGQILIKYQLKRELASIAHGLKGIKQVGHRRYVGKGWHEIGQLQFEYLVEQGLQPNHYLLDIACGSLRGGVHFIPYLEEGHYLGIDKESKLIELGIEKELPKELFLTKKPRFVVSSEFEFEKFGVEPDFALAQSLFTHLTPEMVDLCFRKLGKIMPKHGVFYATYFETTETSVNPAECHDHRSFHYTKEEMRKFGQENGWDFRYIGNWNHPKGQVMTAYYLC